MTESMIDPMTSNILQTLAQLNQLRLEFYIANTLFTWRWWLLIVIAIIPFIVWWLLVDKRRLSKILLYGVIGVVLNVIADEHLINLLWYSYPHRLDPFWGGVIVGDISYPPVIGMLVYQYFPRWKTYIIAVLLGSAFISFVGLPLLKLMGVLVLLRWNYLYSFLLLILYACFIKWLVDKIAKTEEAQI